MILCQRLEVCNHLTPNSSRRDLLHGEGESVLQLLDEMAETNGKEFDFKREAGLMDAIRGRLEGSGLNLQIPRPIKGMSTPNLLVMERMNGE